MRNAPDYIQFYPTLRCSRSCDFCFNRSLPGMQDMTYEAFRAMLGRLKALAVRTIDIMGGEPTMHPEIIGVVREADKQGFRVNVSSNGADPEVLKELCGMGQDVAVGISINDRETLSQLGEFIRQYHPVVKTVYTRGMDTALTQDILALRPEKFYLIYRDVMEQRALADSVSFPHYRKAIARDPHSSRINMVYCSGFLPDTKNYPELSRVRCPAGTTKLGVMPDGAVYPCNLFFGKAGFLLGNILIDPFETIWNHRMLAFFRTYTGNNCPRSSCEYHTQCHGGCPAHAFNLSNDLSAPDPRCVGNIADG